MNAEPPVPDPPAVTQRDAKSRRATQRELDELAEEGYVVIKGDLYLKGGCPGCGGPGHGLIRTTWLRRCWACGRDLCRLCMGNTGGLNGDAVQPAVCRACLAEGVASPRAPA